MSEPTALDLDNQDFKKWKKENLARIWQELRESAKNMENGIEDEPTKEELEETRKKIEASEARRLKNEREKSNTVRTLSRIFESYTPYHTSGQTTAKMQCYAQKYIEHKYDQQVHYNGMLKCEDGSLVEISQFSIPWWDEDHYITVDVHLDIDGIDELVECDRKRNLLAEKVHVDRLDITAYFYVLRYPEHAKEQILKTAEELNIKFEVMDFDDFSQYCD